MTSQLGEQAQVARATARFVRVTPMKARRETGQSGTSSQLTTQQQSKSRTRGGTR